MRNTNIRRGAVPLGKGIVKKTYSDQDSPCCGETGHRPATDTGDVFFCMNCGSTFASQPAIDEKD